MNPLNNTNDEGIFSRFIRSFSCCCVSTHDSPRNDNTFIKKGNQPMKKGHSRHFSENKNKLSMSSKTSG